MIELEDPYGSGIAPAEQPVPAPSVAPARTGPGSLEWMAQHPLDPWQLTAALDPNGVDTLNGPPSEQRMTALADPFHYTVRPAAESFDATPATPLEIAAPGSAQGQSGRLSWNAIDPFTSMNEIGGNTPIGDPDLGSKLAAFFQSRGVDLLSFDAPSRIMDYGIAGPLTMAAGLIGQSKTISDLFPGQSEDEFYEFEKAPGFVQWVGTATEEQLATQARVLAAQYVNSSDVGLYTEALLKQFHLTRDKILGLSSGDERIDTQARFEAFRSFKGVVTGDRQAYNVDAERVDEETLQREVDRFMAIAAEKGYGVDRVDAEGFLRYGAAGTYTVAEELSQAGASIIGFLPFVGTQIAEAIMPEDDLMRTFWEWSKPEDRNAWYSASAMSTMVADIGVLVASSMAISPFIAAGRAAAVSASAGQALTRVDALARNAYRLYDYSLKIGKITMATGITTAVTNWGLSVYSPAYHESIGKYVDAARPISGSVLAGIANLTGMFATGSFGVIPAIQAGRAGASRIPGLAGRMGPVEPRYFVDNHGPRATVGAALAKHGLDMNLQDLAKQSDFMSTVGNAMIDDAVGRWEAVAAGRASGIREVDALPPDARIAYMNEKLATLHESSHPAMEAAIRTMNAGMRRPSLRTQILDDAAMQIQKNADRVSKALNDQVSAIKLSRDAIRLGATIPALRASLRTRMTLINEKLHPGERFDPEALEGSFKGFEDLRQATVTADSALFHLNNSAMQAAAEGSRESRRITMVLQSSLHRGDASEEVLIALRSGGDEAEAVAERMRLTKPEIARMYSGVEGMRVVDGRMEVKAAGEWNTPEELADLLEAIRDALPAVRELPVPGSPTEALALNSFHRQLRDEGIWDIAFKPTETDEVAALMEPSVLDPADPLAPDAVEVATGERFITYRKMPSGRIFKAPWLDYPLTTRSTLAMGNRSLMAVKMDSLFRGWRTARLQTLQIASLHGGLSAHYAGVTTSQTEALSRELMKMAAEHRVAPQAMAAVARVHGTLPFILSDSREAIYRAAYRIFGPTMVEMKTGKVLKIDDVDFPGILARSYRQARNLNMTAGVTSLVYSTPGIGGFVSAWGQVAWPFLKFGPLAPIFRTSEFVESKVFNLLRGVTNNDPMTTRLYHNAGMRSQRKDVFQTEGIADSIIASLGGVDTANPGYSPRGQEAAIALFGSQRASGVAAAGRRADAAAASPSYVPPPPSVDEYLTGAYLGGDASLFPDRYPSSTPIDMLDSSVDPTTGTRSVSLASRDRDARLRQPPLMTAPTPEGTLAIQGAISSFTYQRLDSVLAELPMVASLPPERLALLTDRTPLLEGEIPATWGTPGIEGDISLVLDKRKVMERDTITAGNRYLLSAERRRNILLSPAGALTRMRESTLGHLAQRYGAGERPTFYEALSGSLPAAPTQHVIADGVAWDEVRAIIAPGAQAADDWQRMVDRLPDRHPAKMIEIRVSSGDEVGDLWRYGFEKAGALDRRDIVPEPLTDLDAARTMPLDVVDPAQAPAYVAALRAELGAQGFRGFATVPPLIDHVDSALTRAATLTSRTAMERRVRLEALRDEVAAYERGAVTPSVVARAPRRVDNPYTNLLARVMDVVTQPGRLTFLGDVRDEFLRRGGTEEQLAAALRWINANGAQEGWRLSAGSTMTKVGTRKEAAALARNTIDLGGGDVVRAISFEPVLEAPGPLVTAVNPAADVAAFAARLQSITRKPVPAYHGTIEGSFSFQSRKGTPYQSTVEPADQLRVLREADEAEGVSRETSWADNHVETIAPRAFRDQLRAAAATRLGYDPGVPVVRVYVRGDRSGITRGAHAGNVDVTITVAAPDRRGLGLTQPEIEAIWQRFLPATGSDGGIAWDHVQNGIWTGGLNPPMPTTLADGSVISTTPDPVARVTFSDRFEPARGQGYVVLDGPAGVPVTFRRSGLRTDGQQVRYSADGIEWTYSYDRTGHVAKLPGAEMSSIAEDMRLRDLLSRNGDRPLRIEFSSDATRESIARLWYLGEWRPSSVFVDARSQAVLDDRAIRVHYGSHTELAGAEAITELADVPHTSEGLTRSIKQRLEGTRAYNAWVNIGEWKLGQGDRLVIKEVQTIFPTVLREGNPYAYGVFRSLGIPDDQMARFLVEDRDLLNAFLDSVDGVSGNFDQAAMDRLIAHGGKYGADGYVGRAGLDDLYDSSDWQVINSMWGFSLRAAQEEAFRVHFFNPARSSFERSINHPVLGVYPASWSLKAGREWAKFLFDNRVLGNGHLRLGMSPAIALSELNRRMAVWVAENQNEDLAQILSSNGPMGTFFFVFSLMMPGDWGNIAFPLSRTLRTLIRGQMSIDAVVEDINNSFGFIRDARFAFDIYDETMDVMSRWGKPAIPGTTERSIRQVPSIPGRQTVSDRPLSSVP